MKKYKSANRKVFGIGNRFFAILTDGSKYQYYLNDFLMNETAWFKIKTSKGKIGFLNVYTLTILSLVLTIIMRVLVWPIIALFYPLYLYFNGGYNFVRNRVDATNVALFGWANIIALISLILYVILITT